MKKDEHHFCVNELGVYERFEIGLVLCFELTSKLR